MGQPYSHNPADPSAHHWCWSDRSPFVVGLTSLHVCDPLSKPTRFRSDDWSPLQLLNEPTV